MSQSKLLKRLLQVAGLGAAALAATGAFAGISNTKHNLGTGGQGANHVTSGTAEICVFCHTPHGSDTSAPVPLWNKQLTTGATYTTYSQLGSSTLDAATIATGSVSLACLSCHDGTQAMDNIINAPGSGGFNSTGGGTNGLGYTWTAGATGATVTAEGLLGAGVTQIGADLKNDHPIGITYCGGFSASTCKDSDFVAPTISGSGSTAQWWVNTSGGTSGKEKTDMILYTRDFGGTAGIQGSVECASCHDPHVEAKTPSPQVAFLRVSQEGSGVCLACHTK